MDKRHVMMQDDEIMRLLSYNFFLKQVRGTAIYKERNRKKYNLRL
jgi:hypothetical protein